MFIANLDLFHSELGALLCLKSKYTPGGEFEPDWKPPGGISTGEPGGGGPPDTAILISPEEPIKPAWRNVRERKKSRRTMEREAAAQMAAQAAAEPAGPPPESHASWVSWKRECILECQSESAGY